jgi:acylphosphatase
MQQRCEAYYSGRVQGVGFRYTAQSIAATHSVTGYVHNLPDGRVRLEAEGEREELGRFLKAVAQRMEENIRICTVDFRPATGEFQAFQIRH